MAAYLTRRVLLIVSTLLAVSFGAFVAFGVSFDPSGPLLLSPLGRKNPDYIELRRYYHLNDPIVVRYWHWFTSLFQHGFGNAVGQASGSPPRVVEGEPIGPAIWHAAGLTAQLVGFAMVLVIVGSALVGTIAARRRRFRGDVSTRFLTYVAASVPTFLIADLIRRATVGHEHVLFNSGVSSAGWFLIGPPQGGFVDWFRHLTLPAVALAIGLIGIYSRYIRSSLLVAFSEPYTTVARAKGLPESRVVLRHALRTSLVPFISALSLEFGAVIGASLAADYVFNLGGLASTFLRALGAADPFELTALVVVTALVVSIFVLVADLLVGFLDPRVRA